MDSVIKALLDERMQLYTQSRSLLEQAEKDKRSFTAEEDANYDKMLARMHEIGETLDKRSKLDAIGESVGKPMTERVVAPGTAQPTEPLLGERSLPEYRAAFNEYLREGPGAIDKRALSWGTETGGGALAPETFITTLLKEMDNQLWIRRLATKQQLVVGDTLGVPYLNADPADSDWTTELQTGSEDSTMAFGKREMRPHPLAKLLKVSNTLLQRAALPVEQIVMERLAYKFAVSEEKAFMTGTGAGQPLGLFVASNDGIATTYDVAGDNTATEIAANTLLDMVYGLPTQYWPEAAWLGHRDFVKRVSKLKDGESRYMWQPSIQQGQPNTLVGFPVYMSEYAPNTFTTGLYVAMFGAYSRYWIVDALNMTVQRLVELYAATNQIGFIGRLECVGAPVWGPAFRRMKMG